MKGAFTGASSNKQGLFEAANNGTIFLDEISATTPALQIKLLRVLQEREFIRVGGTAEVTVDVHVIAASNKDLLDEIAKGAFREDLYYRLNVIPIHLPPLRERKDDIPLLAEYFLKKVVRKEAERAQVKLIDAEAMQALMSYHWPGNVRELENTIERMMIMTPENVIRLDQVPDTVKNPSHFSDQFTLEIPDTGMDLEALLEKTERTFLRKALEKTGGVKTDAAKLLGLTFRSFRHRLQKYGDS
jgi:two-component system response regulator PilR (NtrC family)